ncbi:MAG: fimbrial protein [Providencia sp.]|uniref:fimbrial protein n=1 Tax=Providencia sp. TaxID=589 RepID=UPI003F9A01CA
MKEKIPHQLTHIMRMVCLAMLNAILVVSPVIASTVAGVSVKGQLLDFPPCEVYGANGKGTPVHIGFDEVAIQRLDGQRYRQDMTLTVWCDGTLGQNVPIELIYSGAPSAFDPQALMTDKANLGVRLYQDNSGDVVAPNSTFRLTLTGNSSEQLPWYAVPVKAAGANLVEGKFTASATLSLNYP